MRERVFAHGAQKGQPLAWCGEGLGAGLGPRVDLTGAPCFELGPGAADQT